MTPLLPAPRIAGLLPSGLSESCPQPVRRPPLVIYLPAHARQLTQSIVKGFMAGPNGVALVSTLGLVYL